MYSGSCKQYPHSFDSRYNSQLCRLSRQNDSEEWTPLRKDDCRAINEADPLANEIYIEGGRSTADPTNGVIRSNFINRPKRQLMSATWFVVHKKGDRSYQESDPKDNNNQNNSSSNIEGNGSITEANSSSSSINTAPPTSKVSTVNSDNPNIPALTPLSPTDAALVEKLYQQISNSLIPAVVEALLTIKEEGEVMLEDDAGSKVVLVRNGNGSLVLKKKRIKLFGASFDLQRGYGDYSVPGEMEETTLGDVKHLIFVVHGIGESMYNRTENLHSFSDEIEFLRANINKKQIEVWRKDREKARKEG